MSERDGQPDEPDAVDPDPGRAPDPGPPHPAPERGEDDRIMRFPGAEAPDVVGSDAVDSGEEHEAPDLVGSTEEPW